MKQAFEPIPEEEKKYLQNRSYKFFEEMQLPRLLVPWTKESWLLTGAQLVALYTLRSIAKRNGNTYVMYSLGMGAALLVQYMSMHHLDRFHESRSYRKGLPELNAPVTQAALSEVLSECNTELEGLRREIQLLEQKVRSKGLEVPL